MDELLSEKEQIEAIRSWWGENGRYVISGLVIGVGLLFGWNYWKSQQREVQLGASAVYEQLLADVAEAKIPAAEEKAARIADEFSSTVYAPQARLAMSRLYMDVGRDEDAAEQLRQLLALGRDPELATVARLRLGKILLYQDKAGEVIDLLDGYRDTAFAARYSETLGDAYVAEGRLKDASEAYTAALADNPNTPTVDRTLIQMKIYDLPDAAGSEAVEAETADRAAGGDGADTAAADGERPGPQAPADSPVNEPVNELVNDTPPVNGPEEEQE